MLESSLCHLLRTVLAKSEKDTIKAARADLDQVTDIAKVEKHLSQVLDRIVKGKTVVENPVKEGTYRLKTTKIEFIGEVLVFRK